MIDIDLLIERFAETALELALEPKQVTDRILKGVAKGFLKGLKPEEISFLKKLIDSLSQ